MKAFKKSLAILLVCLMAFSALGFMASADTSYTITFDANGGTLTGTTSKNVTEGNAITADNIADPTRPLFAFIGWSSDKSYMAPLGTATAATTIYALWKAASFNGCGEYIFNSTDGTLTLSKCEGTLSLNEENALAGSIASIKHIVIENNAGKTVTLGAKVFKGLTALEDVTINGSVVIGDYAFDGCSNLSKIILKDGTAAAVKGIGAYAFNNCVSFKGINANGMDLSGMSVTDYAKEGAFYGCSSLKSVTLSSDIVTIPAKMFSGCSALVAFNPTAKANVNFPENVSVIGNSAFEGCTALENVVFSSGIYSIGAYAFSGCTAITAIQVYNTILGEGAFYGCKALSSFKYTRLYRVPDQCFAGCTALTEFDFTNVCTSIDFDQDPNYLNNETCHVGISAFEGCTGLKKVTFVKDGFNKIVIDKCAFLGCTALESIIFPENIPVEIGEMSLGYASKGVKATFGTDAKKMTLVCDQTNGEIYDYADGFNRVSQTAYNVTKVMPSVKTFATFFAKFIPVMFSVFEKLVSFVSGLFSEITA